MNNAQGLGLYIHLPFCRSKCPYCDFYSLAYHPGTAERYLEAVVRALQTAPAHGPVDTVYFGGGTPSLMGARALCTLLEAADRTLGIAGGAEITLEANPGTVDAALLGELRAGGFNRLSLGLQSAHPDELAALGRGHTAREAATAVQWAAQAGFERLSLDLMLGTPGQTVETAAQSARYCAELGVGHISAYLLKIEPETPFGRRPPACPDEDTLADSYLRVAEVLGGLGYEQYEISNFAKPGQQCRHNLKYWLCEDYLGVGPAAHSLVEGRRFYFERDLEGFISRPDPWRHIVEDGPGGSLEEQVMLALRLGQGLAYERLRRGFPHADLAGLAEAARPFAQAGLLAADREGIRLTPQGFLVSNGIITALLDALPDAQRQALPGRKDRL